MAIRLSNYVSDGNNYRQVNASVDPTSNDDGHKVGTHWYNTVSGNLFVCGDNSFQAAKWSQFGLTLDTMTPVSASGQATVNLECSSSDNFRIYDATQSFALNFNNLAIGRTVTVHFDDMGAFTVTWPTDFAWPGGSELTEFTAVGYDTLVATRISSARVHANVSQDFQIPVVA